MKLLKDILYRTNILNVTGSTNVAIENICFDSREVCPFSVFVAIRGTHSDGHAYISKSIDSGAIAVVCEELPAEVNPEITYIQVKNSHAALANMACNFYDNPSEKLQLVGVTGTNGKTTCATLMFELFTQLNYKCGLLSTVVNRIHRQEIKATHTTPNPLELNRLLAQMVEEGCTHCFMEVSSHALVQHRTTGLQFRVAVFTNITRDHLDYHQTFDNYIAAKKLLFDGLTKGSDALINSDDFHGEIMVQNSKAKLSTFGLRSMADFKCKIIENDFNGLQLNINGNDVWTRLIGKFNAYNILCVYGVARLLGESELPILTELSKLQSVSGRFQYTISPMQVTGIVDYAHTPDALEKVLETIKDIRTGNEQVITIVGCGGDRDKGKRPQMAQIATKGSDKVIFTSDNPRSEDPEQIIRDMEAGVDAADFKKTLSITNRKDAIKTAVSMAGEKDIILVAGKGHENYQIIGNETYDFNDMEILTDYLNQFAQ
ncbi:UDP-N-acetylmuramoyl-L-alanyl-D-glutamate--2,6-diaminopimelate ligase [bacterium SCSIO 12741]|nr:UDP-N-acetylmuramoyl-L-alanyl-D-glutamate--2,6-diaminopimelate ligase [bacterium SCSIO 12741]